MSVIRGANSPLVTRSITEQLNHEHKVLDGNAERKEFCFPFWVIRHKYQGIFAFTPCVMDIMVPTSTEKVGNLKKSEAIFQSGNFEHSGKVRDCYPK